MDETVQILISWPHQKLADLDLHCLQIKIQTCKKSSAHPALINVIMVLCIFFSNDGTCHNPPHYACNGLQIEILKLYNFKCHSVLFVCVDTLRRSQQFFFSDISGHLMLFCPII